MPPFRTAAPRVVREALARPSPISRGPRETLYIEDGGVKREFAEMLTRSKTEWFAGDRCRITGPYKVRKPFIRLGDPPDPLSLVDDVCTVVAVFQIPEELCKGGVALKP